MMVRIEYEGGRTTLFDTLSFTEGSPFSGANMLTEFELEMREEPEKGLWLTANWHQVRDDWRADAPADGIPAARRARGWRFMLASEAELGRARRVLLDGDEAFARVRGFLCDAAAIGACYREHVGPPSKPLKSQIRDLQRALGRAEVARACPTSWRGCSRKRRRRAPTRAPARSRKIGVTSMKRLGRFLMAALKVTLGFFVWLFRAVFKWVM